MHSYDDGGGGGGGGEFESGVASFDVLRSNKEERRIDRSPEQGSLVSDSRTEHKANSNGKKIKERNARACSFDKAHRLLLGSEVVREFAFFSKGEVRHPSDS
eukprot:jgi/Picsp_1/5660/NSC_03019-R1_---NA---